MNAGMTASELRSTLSFNLFGTEDFLPFSAVAYFRIKENRIIIKRKSPISSDFILVTDNNVKKIVRVLSKYIKRKD